jgi:hypothetical protein
MKSGSKLPKIKTMITCFATKPYIICKGKQFIGKPVSSSSGWYFMRVLSMSIQKTSSFLGSTVGVRQLGITVIAASNVHGT